MVANSFHIPIEIPCSRQENVLVTLSAVIPGVLRVKIVNVLRMFRFLADTIEYRGCIREQWDRELKDFSKSRTRIFWIYFRFTATTNLQYFFRSVISRSVLVTTTPTARIIQPGPLHR